MNDFRFGSFVRKGKTYNCAYNPNETNRKGVLVHYWRDEPAATNFYRAPDECRVKPGQIRPLQ
jgi:hypothetical protein